MVKILSYNGDGEENDKFWALVHTVWAVNDKESRNPPWRVPAVFLACAWHVPGGFFRWVSGFSIIAGPLGTY